MNDKLSGSNVLLLRRLSLAAVLLAMVVVVLGAYTRLVDAGLGCPDWPGCYGFLVAPHTDEHIRIATERVPDAPVETHKGWAEMTHRYVAGSLLLLILAILVVSVRQRRRDGDAAVPVKLPLAIFILVIWQAIFGMWTVTLKLWPQIVTLHLLGGFATLSLLWLLALRLRPQQVAVGPDQGRKLRALRPWALGAILVVTLQVMLGGWTSSNYAALACTDLPTCQGEYWPHMDFAQGFDLFQHIGPNYLGGRMDNEARVAIHVTHRLGAMVVVLYLGLLLWRLWPVLAGTWLTRPLMLVAGALLLQVGLGLSNILWLLPLPVAVAHNAGGAFLLLMLIWLNQRLHLALRPAPGAFQAQETYHAQQA